VERLKQRAAQAGMELVVDATDDARAASLRTNAAAVEQILMNLVDNACKYARPASGTRESRPESGRIELDVRLRDGALSMRVRDHGPGIRERDLKRLFRPFGKSAQQAANSEPGVGLGLALSRRLARDLGGDLRPILTDDGACFELTLPVS
jgi:signal transduction histidine kinase